jgi:hypothetical protein
MSGLTGTSADAAAIRTFTIPIISAAELEALCASITEVRWLDPQVVADHPGSVQLAVTGQ